MVCAKFRAYAALGLEVLVRARSCHQSLWRYWLRQRQSMSGSGGASPNAHESDATSFLDDVDTSVSAAQLFAYLRLPSPAHKPLHGHRRGGEGRAVAACVARRASRVRQDHVAPWARRVRAAPVARAARAAHAARTCARLTHARVARSCSATSIPTPALASLPSARARPLTPPRAGT